MKATDILVVGAGFAGVNAMIAAARVGAGRLSVSLVAPEHRLVIRPRLYEAAPGRLSFDLRPVAEMLGVTLLQAEISALKLDESVAVCASGEGLRFGRLVLATGGQMSRPPIPGASAGFSVDNLRSAVALENELQRRADRGALHSIAIVGAGFTGIEVALQLRQRLDVLCVGNNPPPLITLLDVRDSLDTELGAEAVSALQNALSYEKVDLCLGARIVRIEDAAVVLEGRERLPADLVIFCTGQRANPLIEQIPGEKDMFGRLITDASLRAPQSPSVFGAGDVVQAPAAPGRSTVMSCQHAIGLGKVAGENAARDLLGLPMIDFHQPNYVTCLDLGRWGAVLTDGWERRFALAGRDAKRVKRFINERAIYPPHGERAEILAASLPTLGVTAADLIRWSRPPKGVVSR